LEKKFILLAGFAPHLPIEAGKGLIPRGSSFCYLALRGIAAQPPSAEDVLAPNLACGHLANFKINLLRRNDEQASRLTSALQLLPFAGVCALLEGGRAYRVSRDSKS
jgi:hypothetical protein